MSEYGMTKYITDSVREHQNDDIILVLSNSKKLLYISYLGSIYATTPARGKIL